MLLQLLRHVVPLNDGNRRLTMRTGRCAQDVLLHSSDIGLFKTVKKNFSNDCLAFL